MSIDTERYQRHLNIPGFGKEQQEALSKASVLVVGAGGLGCPLLQYLAAAGVGRIGIVDGDKVELSNLQRQVLFLEQDLGRSKSEVAATRLRQMNSELKIEIFNEMLSAENARNIISKFDVVCDGTDNFPTRYLVNDTCVDLGKVIVHGSVSRFEGQVSVFNFRGLPAVASAEAGPNYRDLFPEAPQAGSVQDCATAGVIGVLPGIIGSLMALEVIKVITGLGEPLSGKLLTFDGQDMRSRIIEFKKSTKKTAPNNHLVNEISYSEYEKDRGRLFLVDVRESHEREAFHIGGLHIPLGDLVARLNEIPSNKPVLFYCEMGIRSAQAVMIFGNSISSNLKDGIQAQKDHDITHNELISR